MDAQQHEGVRDDQRRGVVASDSDRVNVLSQLLIREFYLTPEQQVQNSTQLAICLNVDSLSDGGLINREQSLLWDKS